MFRIHVSRRYRLQLSIYELDKISIGDASKENYLNDFYFSKDSHIGLVDKLKQEHDREIARLIMSIDDSDNKIEIRIGRYGVYAQINEDRVTVDKDIIPSAKTYKPAYLVYNNYEKILSWNRSLRFALAVCTLKENFKNEI